MLSCPKKGSYVVAGGAGLDIKALRNNICPIFQVSQACNIEYDNKFTVGQHGAGGMRLQKIIDVLGDVRAESPILSDAFPEREQEIGAVLMLEQKIYFINDASFTGTS